MDERNPWIAQHIEGETLFQSGDGRSARRGRQIAEAVVASEYLGAPGPFPCPCGGTFWYRATIGAHKCPDCDRLALSEDDIIENRP